jgi:hypothetical protein
MLPRLSLAALALALTLAAGAAIAQDPAVIDPAATPGKARFMALAQEKFDQDPDAMFQTSRIEPGQRQAVFECGMKAVLADMPDTDAGRLADMVEGKTPADAALAKWFELEESVNKPRHDQVAARARAICPSLAHLLK